MNSRGHHLGALQINDCHLRASQVCGSKVGRVSGQWKATTTGFTQIWVKGYDLG